MEKKQIVKNEQKAGERAGFILGPVYAILQKDRHLRKGLLDNIKNVLKDIGDKNGFIDHESIDAKNTDFGLLVIKCKTPPFFGSHRLIEIENADKFCSSPQFEEYLKDPQRSTCLVLEIEKSVALLKNYELKPKKLFAHEKTELLRKKIAKSGKTISVEALTFFQEVVGDDFLRMDHEIEKILLYCGEKNNICLEDIGQISSCAASEKGIFNLTDEVSAKNKKNSLKILKELFLHEDETRILGMLVRQFRIFLNYKEMQEKGSSKTEMIKRIGIKQDWMFDKLQRQGRNFTLKELKNKFKYLVSADLEMKSGRINRLTVLEILISRLCS